MKILLILGILLAVAVVIIIIVIANCIPSFNDRRKGEALRTPSSPGAKRRFWPGLVILILALAVVVGVMKMRSHPLTAYPIAANAQEYKLSAGQEVCTKTSIGPGITLRFWANKPFSVVTYNLEGPTGEYGRPSGESFCRGSNPSGPLVVRGDFDGTVVQIQVVH